MGVSGAGKTTLGLALASRLGWSFEDADDYHDPESLAKMARGEGLDDADRDPWLDRLSRLVEASLNGGPPTVLACSALKAAYRTRLHTDAPGALLVWLDASPQTLAARLQARRGHVAGPDLLPSQLATLEVPDRALRLDASRPVPDLVRAVVEAAGL